MRRFLSILILLVCSTFLTVSPAAAWFFADDTLVTIDGARYSTEDFKRWWRFWKDEGVDLPKTADPFVDWLLLAREGERMELAKDPSFQRQTKVFLQSRTLLMLKYDAVDSRIKITEPEIWSRYEEVYTPRWLVERLHFKDEETAALVWRKLGEALQTFEEILAYEGEGGGLVSRQESWLRIKGIDPGWAGIFQTLSIGEVAEPSQHEGGAILYRLKDRKGGDKEDFAKLREQVRREIWKERENQLTQQLLSDLRRKYEVRVDEERLALLDLNAPDDSSADAVVISTNRQNVTERDFVTIARRDMSLRPEAAHAGFDEEKARELKDRVVSGVIAQSLTNWEALERHYEGKEPFKWEYDFHVNHRLTTALENRLFTREAVVSEEEIKSHYEGNLPRFTQPARFKLYIIDDTQAPVDQVWTDVVVGKDFPRALREHFGRTVSAQEVPVNHLDPIVQAVADKLSAGETSQPFSAQGSRVIVHLIERIPEEPLPLERVAGAIRTRLVQEKVEQKRQSYLELLKSRSRIEVRERKWQAVKRELGGVQ